MNLTNNLNARWNNLAKKFNAPLGVTERLYQHLIKAYSDTGRHYHNLSHLEFIFAEIDRQNIAEPVIEMATWYHDFVYRPGSRSNERKSAGVAQDALTLLGMESNLIDKVKAMILATRDHACEPEDETTALFLDLDMAILGAEPDVYRRYAEAIRKEAGRLPDVAYRKARAEFLASLGRRDAIFLTPRFRDQYEKPARRNIEAELALIKRG